MLLVLGAGFGIAVWVAAWNPETILRETLPLFQEVEKTQETVAGRTYQDMVLADADGQALRFTVSLPQDVVGKKLPTLVVISGFRSARHNLERIPDHGENAIISYQYPYEPTEWRESTFAGRARIARRVAYRLPDEVAALVAWTRRQSWADAEKINLAGISLGAVAMPIIQRRTVSSGSRIAATVIAYGGVDLQALIARNLKIDPSFVRQPLAFASSLLLRPLEPSHHLPHLSGPVLLINGTSDERIPKQSIQSLIELTPEPKSVLVINGPHIDGNQPEIILQTVDAARNWLQKNGVLN